MIAEGIIIGDAPVPAGPWAEPQVPAPRPVGWRSMRIAYLTTQYPKVSHTFIRRELRELERRGHYVLRLAIRPPDSGVVDPADVEEASRTMRCLSESRPRLVAGLLRFMAAHPWRAGKSIAAALRSGWRSERGLPRYFAYLAEAAWLLRVLVKHRIEHVHVHFGTNAAVVARLIRHMGGPPFSVTVHGPDELDAPRSWRLADLQADAAFVVAITDYCSAQLRRWARPDDWRKIHVVHCGVDDQFLGEASPVDSRSRTFTCVGRLCPQKGQLLLVEAMARLQDRGYGCRLILAGDGEMRQTIERRIAALRLNDSVHITGWIGERYVRAVIRESRAMVLPSFAEGLPVVIMEAMAMGRPVISTYVAGIPELVRDGQTGWLVPAGNIDRLADAMMAALDADADRLTRMGSVGAELVRIGHNAATQAAQIESLMLSTLDHRR